MYAAVLPRDADETQFRAVARRLLAAGLRPQEVAFVDAGEGSLLPPFPESDRAAPAVTVSRAYADLLRDAICHRASDRFALLYDVLWRITDGEREIVSRAADPTVARLNDYARNVRRDI